MTSKIRPFVKLKKVLKVDPELTSHFLAKIAYLPQMRNFSEKSLIQLLYTSCFLPLCKNFKRTFRRESRVIKMCHFWVQNSQFAPNKNFFKKSINNPCSFHPFLSTCKKSIEDVNLLMRYWRLRNTEIWLLESIFGYKLRTMFFPGM